MKRQLSRFKKNLQRRYPFFNYLSQHKLAITISLFIYAIFVAWTVYYSLFGENNHWREFTSTFTPIFFEIFIVFCFASIVIAINAISQRDHTINPSKNSEFIYIPAKEKTNWKIEVTDYFYTMPGSVECLIEHSMPDRIDYFQQNVGSFDVPKLSLTRIDFTKQMLYLGGCKYFDIYYTNYFTRCELYTEWNKKIKPNLDDFLLPAAKAPLSKKTETLIEPTNLLPNPLGVTGLVKLYFKNNTYTLFQKRSRLDVAAKGYYQLSFAGTVDMFPDFFPSTTKDLLEFAWQEFNEEIIDGAKMSFLNLTKINCDFKFIGIAFNPNYLYQPELFVTMDFNINESNNQAVAFFKEVDKKITLEIEGGITITKQTPLEFVKSKESLKNQEFRPICRLFIENMPPLADNSPLYLLSCGD